jgi:hypothetical protein
VPGSSLQPFIERVVFRQIVACFDDESFPQWSRVWEGVVIGIEAVRPTERSRDVLYARIAGGDLFEVDLRFRLAGTAKNEREGDEGKRITKTRK